MDPRVSRFVQIGIEPEVAEALIEAGFFTPRLIKRATKSALQKVRGIGSATADSLKGQFPTVKR